MTTTTTTTMEHTSEPVQTYTPSQPYALQIDFSWGKFQNRVSEKYGNNLEPLFIQHFRPTKPQLRYERVSDKAALATGTINNVSISAECTIQGRTIELKPLKRWKTQYNYLSHAFSSTSDPVPITWAASMSLKRWDFHCLDPHQNSIAKFSVNMWAIKEVGNFYFEKSKEEMSEELRDEVLFTGLTILYVMMTRVNNPLNLLGSAFAKPGLVDASKSAGADVQDGPESPKRK